MFGRLNYIIFDILFIAFLIFAFVIIVKKKIKVNPIQRRVLFSVIAFCYVLNILDKIVSTNINPDHLYNVIPFGNYSPFVFSLCTILVFFPEKWIKWFKYFIGIMWIPMLVGGLYNGISFLWSQGECSYTCFTFDVFAHGLIGLYGFSLLISKEIVFNKKSLIWTIVGIMLVPVVMLILNAIFGTSFFGLDLNGKHNIYGLVLTSNSILSALIYFAGLAALVALSSFITLKIQRRAS